MTKREFARVIASLLLVVCAVAWLLDFVALAVSSGGPNYTMSGLSAPEIASRTHSYHVAVLWSYIMPGLFFADLVALWLLRKRKAIS